MSNQTILTIPSELHSGSPSSAIVDLSAIFHNLTQLRQRLHPGCQILGIVKADAYGHGAVPVAKALSNFGMQGFGVSTVQEGVTLRENGIKNPILVLGGIFPWQLSDLVEHALTPVISSEETAFQLAERLGSRDVPYPVHVKIDTGMRRLGFSPDAVWPLLQTRPFQRVLKLEGLMTHLADADNPTLQGTQEQIQRFESVIEQLRSQGVSIPLWHMANTAGILKHPSSHGNLVRPGLMLYGYSPDIEHTSAPFLRPALRITTRIVTIRSVPAHEPLGYNWAFRTLRPSRIATLPVGYAHGFSRRLSTQGAVLTGGQRAPIVGKICMDMMLIDITDIPGISVENEVVLLGKQGSEEITAWDLARWQDTVPYEVLCATGPRLHRVYASDPNQIDASEFPE